jgi:hypothetical protein
MSHAMAFSLKLSNCRLWVVPYIHSRLIFAEAAVRTLHKRVFDTVLLDLPSFMNHDSWLDAPLEAFPLVSSLLIKEDGKTCSLFPMVPTDASCAAAWFARRRSLAFECVDPIISLNGSSSDIPKATSLGDERLISSIGLKSYFETAWHQLDGQLENTPDSSIKNLMFHGKAVAERIRNRISSSRRVLFVCEYRLWWAVKKALDMPAHGECESGKEDRPLPARSCALLLEDPYFMWSAGLFDDYLAINKKFQKSLQSGSIASFSKYETLAGLIGNLLKKGDLTNISNDAKEALASLAHELRHKSNLGLSRDLSPARFFCNIRSELGDRAEDELTRMLLDYPMPTVLDTAKNPPQFFKIKEERIVPDNARFNLPDVFHANPYGEVISSENESEDRSSQPGSIDLGSCLRNVHPVITRQEAKELREYDFGIRWAVKRDYELHAHACRTICQALSPGERTDAEKEELGEFTPISFIFYNGPQRPRKHTVISDNNVTQRQMNLGYVRRSRRDKMPPPDSVYSLFATTRENEILLDDHIERELITSLTLLFSGAAMGLERYDAITQRAKKYQCRTRPQEDPDLEAFRYPDLGLAWAIKYAQKSAIAVACRGWEPSPAVQEFARKKRKQIRTLPLDILPGELTGRLQQLHFISTPLKRHSEREKIVARFVR